MSLSTKYKTYINSLDKHELIDFVKIVTKSEANICSDYVNLVNRMTDFDYIDNLINKRLTDVAIHTINMLKLGIIKLKELENLEKIYFNTNKMNIIIEAIKHKIILRQILLKYTEDINYDFNNNKSYSDLKKTLSEDYNINCAPTQPEIKMILNSINFHQFIIKISEENIKPFLDYVKNNKIIFNNDESENKPKITEFQKHTKKLYTLSQIPSYEDLKEVVTRLCNYTNKVKPYY